MSLATLAQNQAAMALGRYGVAVTLVRTTPGAYDPTTGTTGTRTAVVVKALVKPASAGTIQAFDIRFESGTLIETNLRALEIPAKGLLFVPGPGDAVEGLEGSTWTVLGCTPESVMGVAVIYKMTVRR